MKKRLLSWLLCAAMVIGLLPTMAVTALADELAEAYTLSDDYISVSVSQRGDGHRRQQADHHCCAEQP